MKWLILIIPVAGLLAYFTIIKPEQVKKECKSLALAAAVSKYPPELGKLGVSADARELYQENYESKFVSNCESFHNNPELWPPQ